MGEGEAKARAVASAEGRGCGAEKGACGAGRGGRAFRSGLSAVTAPSHLPSECPRKEKLRPLCRDVCQQDGCSASG